MTDSRTQSRQARAEAARAPCDAAASAPPSKVSNQLVVKAEAVASASVVNAMAALVIVAVQATVRGSRCGVGSQRARTPVVARVVAARTAATAARPAT